MVIEKGRERVWRSGEKGYGGGERKVMEEGRERLWRRGEKEEEERRVL